jgi:hypothetical protein
MKEKTMEDLKATIPTADAIDYIMYREGIDKPEATALWQEIGPKIVHFMTADGWWQELRYHLDELYGATLDVH